MMKLVEAYELGELYDIASLSFASMPFRFLFLSIDTVEGVITLLIVKFSYKLNKYLITPVLETTQCV